jgi:hypothetical protein
MSEQEVYRDFRSVVNRLLYMSETGDTEEITSGFHGKLEITVKEGKVVNIKKNESFNIKEK